MPASPRSRRRSRSKHPTGSRRERSTGTSPARCGYGRPPTYRPDSTPPTTRSDGRTYRYHLYAPARVEETDHDHAVDDGRVRDALARLSGEQDFHNLTSDETGTVRDLTTTATREGDILVVEVSAGGFPRALVRRLVAAVRAVGRGTADPP